MNYSNQSQYLAEGYVIIENFINEEEIKELIKLKYKSNFDNSNCHVSEKLWMSTSEFPNQKIYKICLDILSKADQYIPWFQKFKNMQEYISLRNPFFRFNSYNSSTNNNFSVHYDGKENDSAMLFLTEFGKDYLGGLYIWDRFKNHSPILIDQFCNKGDLLLFDANRFIHWVDVYPISTSGRLSLMAAFSPRYRFGSNYAKNLSIWIKPIFRLRCNLTQIFQELSKFLRNIF